MANAGTVDVAIQATGVARFTSAVKRVRDRLRDMGKATGEATMQSDNLAKAMERARDNMGGFSKAATSAAAAMGAFVSAQKAFSLAEASNQTQRAAKVFESAGGSIEELRTATQGMVSDANLVKKANLAEIMGINGKQFQQLARIALASSAKTGQSVEFLFDSIIIGTARQSRLILDNLGIIVKVGQANETYAASLGKTVKQLNDTEKRQAFMNAVMVAGEQTIQSLITSGVPLKNVFDVFTTTLSNASGAVGKLLVPAFAELIGFMAPVTAMVNRFSDAWKLVNPEIKRALGRLTAVGIAVVTAGAGIGLVATAIPLIGSALLAAGTAAAALITPLANIVFFGVLIAATAGVARTAWEEDWNGIRETVRTAFKDIVTLTQVVAKTIVATFVEMGNLLVKGIVFAINMGIDSMFLLPIAAATVADTWVRIFQTAAKTIGGVMAGMVSMFADVAESLPNVSAALGLDPTAIRAAAANFGQSIDDAADGARVATKGILADLKETRAGFQFKVELSDPANVADELAKLPQDLQLALGFAAGTDTAKGFLESAKDGLKLIVQDVFGVNLDDLWIKAGKKGGAAAGAAAGGMMGPEISKAMLKARGKFAERLAGLRDREAIGTAPFKDLARVTVDTNRELMEMSKLAKEAGLSMNEASGLIKANAARGLAAGINSTQNLDQFSRAMQDARKRADDLGISFDKVAKNIDFAPENLSDVLSLGVGKALELAAGKLGSGLSSGAQSKITGKLSDSLGSMLEGGALDFGSIGQGLGQLLGGAVGSKLAGAAGAIGAGISGGGAAGSAVAPGVGTAVGAAAGAAVGMMLGKVLGKVGPIIVGLFNKVRDGVVSIINGVVKGIPRLVSGFAGKLASFVPEERFQGFIKAAFNPLIGSVAIVAASLVALAPALLLFGAVLSPFMAAINPLTKVFLVTLGVMTSAIGQAAALFAAWVAGGLGPVVVGFAALHTVVSLTVASMAGMAAVTVGLALGFAFLAKKTKSFDLFTKAFEGSIDRLVGALEPVFQNLLPMAGLFDAVVSVLIPMASAFASNELAARALFSGFKVAAIGLSVFIFAVAVLVNAVLAATVGLANSFAFMLQANMNMQNAINTLTDTFLRAGVFILGAIRFAFGDIMPKSLREGLDSAVSRLGGSIGAGTAAQNLAASLREIAVAAENMSPDLNAMGQAIVDLTNLSFDEAGQRARALAAQKEINEQLTNVPQGVKVALSRFRATERESFGSGVISAGVAETGESGGNFFVERITVVTDNVDDMRRQIEEESERKALQQDGSTGTNDGQNNGSR